MQGIFIGIERPRSKKHLRETVASDPERVSVEATSLFGDEYEGSILDMPHGSRIHFVGPNPYTKRNFYGTLTRAGDGAFKVT